MSKSVDRGFAIVAFAIVVLSVLVQPAPAATPEGTIAALLMQVVGGSDNENPGTVSGTGFNCNAGRSDAAFNGDFPEAGPCLRFFSQPQEITLIASPRANYAFSGWQCQSLPFLTSPVITVSTTNFPFTGSGHVPDCLAQFRRSECFVPPDGEDLLAGQVEECPADDPVDCPEGGIAGDEDDNVIDGTEGDDIICGLGGNDTINGLGGSDIILGGAGDDTIDGGDGSDVLFGDSGHDLIFGGNEKDAILGGSGPDGIDGQMGDDALSGGTGVDVIYGSGGNDSLEGGDGADRLIGGPGDDLIRGHAGRDTIFGCGGSDKLDGGPLDDSLFGDFDDAEGICQQDVGQPGAGNANPARDVLVGGRGDDLMLGNGGNDSLLGLAGNDRLDGGAGNDVMRGGDGVDQLTANDGNSDALHGGDDCDGAGGLFDQGLDTLLSIEQPDDVCIIPLP